MAAGKRKTGDTSGKRGPKAKRTTPVLNEALAEAAWLEADAALAQALTAFELLSQADTGRERSEAMALLDQALIRAVRRRGLTRFGATGGREPYDPARHDLAEPGERPPRTVCIVGQGVMRGCEILAPARVRKAP